MKKFILALTCLFFAIPCGANPIPIPPPASMPLEDMHIVIQPCGDALHATFTGDYTFDYIPEDVLSMLFPVPPDANNIAVWQDGVGLLWTWSSETYPTILPEMPTIPMIEWLGPFPEIGAVFRVDYEHDLIERPEGFIFFYAIGTGKYFPTYEKTTTAYFDILLPAGFAVTGVWLDYTPHGYEVINGHLMITVRSDYGPITKDLIVSLVQTLIYVATDGNDATGDGSPENPFATIQKGIDTAIDGRTVIVQPGTYTGAGNRDINFLGKAITVRSIDPNNPNIVATTIIDCNGTYAENHRGFYFKKGEGQDSVLDGLTITNAYVVVMCEGGAAIYCQGSSPTIRNCIITANTAKLDPMSLCYCYGGAIYIGDGSSPTITKCVISDNSVNNWGWGGGICCDASSIIMRNCLIVGNSANGYGSDGGGIYSFGGHLTLYNCTVSDNTAYGNGGGIYFRLANRSDMYIVSCIIWGNSPDQIYTDGTGSGVVWYSDVQGGWPGPGPGGFPPNMKADPCFADSSSGDYHLKSQVGRWEPSSQSWVQDDVTSPCIDAGHPASDWTAELWPHGKRINMGAYGGTPQASMSLSNVGNIADLDNDDFVGYNDLRLFTGKWLNQQVLLKEDLDRNGFVDFIDFAIFAENWLWQ
jgi:hypothetical protein